MENVGFLVKSDSNFFEGLKATLASIKLWHPDIPVRILDCGLTERQTYLLKKGGIQDIIKLDLSNFQLFEAGKDLYSNAVFAILMASEYLFENTFHLDADAVLCKPIHEVLFSGDILSLKAVPDFPYLNYSHQIGGKDNTTKKVMEIIPNLDLNATTFNAGIFYLNKNHYIDKMHDIVLKLVHLHDQLWGNEMAILNLAAFSANPGAPYQVLDPIYNHRPSYRRAPKIPMNSIIGTGQKGEPMLKGHFGKISILHFIGKSKPWGIYNERDPSLQVWRFYHSEGNKLFKN